MSVNPLETVVPPQAPASGQPAAAPTPERPALYTKAGGDWTKANDSYFNAVKELQTKNQQLEQIAQRNQQLEAFASQVLSGQPAGNADPLDALNRELGLPVQPFRDGIRSEVEAVLTQLLAPTLKQVAADEALADEIPNFPQLKGEARVFMKANPEIEAVFNAVRQADPAAAWKYAIRESLIARGGGVGPQTPRHAGLPGGASVAGRIAPTPEGPAQQTRESEALAWGRSPGGEMGPYLHERFKGTSVERAVAAALRQIGYEVPGEGQ